MTDWQFLLAFFVIVNLISAGFAVYLFTRVERSDIFTVKREGPIQFDALDRSLLRRTISHFEEREKRFTAFKQEKPQTVDPSL